ncbi:MAG TPA: DUF3025 domain-containing protein [Polyangiaceae bacterium]|jgi:hypothetical protein
MLVLVPDRSFDGRFFEAHALFWPIAPAASTFAGELDWPPVEAYERAFVDPTATPVRFEAAPPARGRRRAAAVDPRRLYDARITREGCVPTRPRSWHDFLNALVWATFPRAKLALHRRQHRALVERIPEGARTLPPTRSREHDALALLDEGGVVVLDDGRSRERVLFGHALYEGLVLGRGAMTACAIAVPVTQLPCDPRARCTLADEALAGYLETAALDPRSLDRVHIDPDLDRDLDRDRDRDRDHCSTTRPGHTA